MAQYGHFDDTAKEYVITRPDTPRPWSNYLGSAEFGGVITNNAAGYTFYRSAAQGRLSRYMFNAKPGELPGRYLYLRDQDNGDYWSNSWMPVGKPLESFQTECRHGTGYSVIRSAYTGITSTVTYFVKPGTTYETWRIEISNTSEQHRRIQLFPFVEPQCNWSAQDDMNNLQYDQYIATTTQADGIIDIGSNINMPEDRENFTNKDQARHTFFALSGVEADGFDGDLTAFFGPYGTYARPQAVVNGQCTNATAGGDMPAAAFQVNVDLTPGESRTFSCVYGVGKPDAAHTARTEADSAEKLEASLQAVKDYWHSRLDTLRAQTPDPAFNSMVNAWSPYNNLMTFYWSRAASLVYAGERDGLGFRDTLQDIVGSAALITEETCERLELMLTGQYSHGGCKPVVQPFNHHPGHEAPPDHFRADDGMWFFNAVPAYVKETGDIGFYEKVLPFADEGASSVFGHLRRAIEFNLKHCGAHDLPCGLHADWNDCIRLGQRGESIFVAMQLRYALSEYIEIADLLGEQDEITWATKELAGLDRRLEAYAWDGEWYLRAYRDDGFKFGSSESEEGKIFMNPQTWAVLSGHATDERAHEVMNAMHEHLNTEYGIMLCTPAYVSTDPAVCLGRLFNPGMKENGGIFNHTQGWAIMAAAKLGLGERAYEYLTHVLPASFNDRAEIRQVEPYVVCQSTHSRLSPRYGNGRVSWLSGTAVWNYVAMTTAILGIQPDYEGLRIAPCIPSSWPEYKVSRRFRGATYEIEIRNPDGKNSGVRSIMLDDVVHEGDIIPPAPAGSTVQIVVTL